MNRIHLKRLLIVGLLLINQIYLFSQNSLNFDGIDDNVTIPNGGELNNLQTATIEMWVKWNGTSQDIGASCYGAILGRQKDNTFNNQVIGLDGADPNLSKILWKPYTHVTNAITSSTSPNNDWIHLAITYTSGDHRMYINGILEGTSTLTGIIQNDVSIPLSVGAWIDDGHSYANANIVEFRVWNVVRSQSEIQNDMNNVLNGNESNLVAYYSFNQGVANGDNSTETVLLDSSINNNNGILNNFSLSGILSNWVGDSVLSIDDIKIKEKEIVLYPNPSDTFIQILGITEDVNYVIYNILGEKVLNGMISNKQNLEIRNITNGLYFLNLENSKSFLFIKE